MIKDLQRQMHADEVVRVNITTHRYNRMQALIKQRRLA